MERKGIFLAKIDIDAKHDKELTYHIGAVSRFCRTWYRHRPSDGEREFDPRFLRGERLSQAQPRKKGDLSYPRAVAAPLPGQTIGWN
jgi:hypothetical protein